MVWLCAGSVIPSRRGRNGTNNDFLVRICRGFHRDAIYIRVRLGIFAKNIQTDIA